MLRKFSEQFRFLPNGFTLISQTKLFSFVRLCLYCSRYHKLRSYPGIYIGIFILFFIYEWHSTSSVKLLYIPTYRQHQYFLLTQGRYIVLKNKFKNLCDWFVVNKSSIILLKIKLYEFFSKGKSLPELKITYDNNGIKHDRTKW